MKESTRRRLQEIHDKDLAEAQDADDYMTWKGLPEQGELDGTLDRETANELMRRMLTKFRSSCDAVEALMDDNEDDAWHYAIHLMQHINYGSRVAMELARNQGPVADPLTEFLKALFGQDTIVVPIGLDDLEDLT